ncbi:hypothetical protein [Nitratireductor sp. StC3]|uniref:hypothetical protein n=1 Tax=Nitratireductor sp. StC3 TaxID=2126741 RepID=UPI001304F826|nr:hypothetical protein [Nitratireductor sp. StC3]
MRKGASVRNLLFWVAAGALAGLAAGSPFGSDYMLAGAGLGMAGGLGIHFGLRR